LLCLVEETQRNISFSPERAGTMTASPGKDNLHLLTQPELLSAKAKLSEVASFYDPTRFSFDGFQAKNLEPYEFRQQIFRIFEIELSDKELGCITAYFDDGTGRIPLYLFMHEFFELGRRRKERKLLASRQRRAIQESAVKKQRDEFLATILPRSGMVLPTEWTEDEERSAFNKFNKIAVSYKGHHYLLEVRFFACGWAFLASGALLDEEIENGDQNNWTDSFVGR
jgi:hypothetical protein